MPRPVPLGFLALTLLSACAGGSRLRLTRADVVGTRWVEACPDPEIRTAFVQFDADGRLAWSYEHPDSVRAENVHTWEVRADTLFLKWSNGTAATAYLPTSNPARLEGTATFCPEGAWIQRIR